LALRSAFRILALPKILRLGNAQINLALRSAFRIFAGISRGRFVRVAADV
jgi:hypothetical protein